jgi:putative transposase
MIIRRYNFKLYPNATQAARLDVVRSLHCRLYNALLEQRIDAFERCGKSLTYFDQTANNTKLRAVDHDYKALGSASMNGTAKRLDEAYKAFFARAKKGDGASSGFPRYQGSEYYSGFPLGKPKAGWDCEIGEKKGRVRIQSIEGWIKMRGCLPNGGTVKNGEILYRGGEWFLSVAVETESRRVAGTRKGVIGLDLMTQLAKIVDGECLAGPEVAVSIASDGRITLNFQGFNGEAPTEAQEMRGDDKNVVVYAVVGMPAEAHEAQGDDSELRNSREEVDCVGQIQQAMARCKRGSNRYKKLRTMKARLEARQANQRANRLHNLSAAIAREFGEVTIYQPKSIKDATATGAGDRKEHGAKVKWKAGFNRFVLSMAPAMFVGLIKDKITEAGGTVAEKKTAHVVELGNEIVKTAKVAKKLMRKEKAK